MSLDYQYLIMGDSLQKTGINPTLVSDKVLNLGLPGAKPLGQYIMLKRYLKKHKPPKAIFLYVDPEDAGDSSLVILRYFVRFSEYLSIWRDLTWRERGYFILRYWVSLDTRKVGLTLRDRYPGSNNDFVNSMKENQGYMPSPGAEYAIDDDYFLKTKERYQDKVTISERDMKYLDKIVELASSKGIKIVFMGFVLPKELYGILEGTGFNKDYLSFLKLLKKRYPNTYFTKTPILYLENGYYGDTSHMNKVGTLAYTTHFKNQIFIPMEAIK